MTDIQKELNEAEEMLKDAINEEMELLTLVRNLNTLKPVNEKTWHKITLTPLRTSKVVMSALTKSIFPDAEDITVGCNAVQCHLYGFTILIPTSVETCIYIDTSWYEKTETKSFECWSYNQYNRLQDFLDDKNPSISAKVKYAIGNWYSKPRELMIYLMRRKEIITEYIFADYNMDVLNRYLNVNDQDQLHRKALLTEALRKAVIALGK